MTTGLSNGLLRVGATHHERLTIRPRRVAHRAAGQANGPNHLGESGLKVERFDGAVGRMGKASRVGDGDADLLVPLARLAFTCRCPTKIFSQIRLI